RHASAQPAQAHGRVPEEAASGASAERSADGLKFLSTPRSRAGAASASTASGRPTEILQATALATTGAPVFQNAISSSSVPLNRSRSQRPTPSTSCGSGPAAPSVYCHSVHRDQIVGINALGPYCAIHNQQFDSTVCCGSR